MRTITVKDSPGGCGGGMLNLQSGDRIELFYEDAPARRFAQQSTVC